MRQYSYALFFLLATLGPKVGLTQNSSVNVTVTGVEKHLETNIRAFLGIERLVGRTDIDAARILSAHRRAPNEIERALQPFGYYSPGIIDTVDEEGGAWTATYEVTAGNPVMLGEVQISATGPGENNPEILAQLDHPSLQEGLRLDHGAYEDIKARIFAIALSQGYLDAEFSESVLEVRPEEEIASIRLVLDTGPQYRFGPITIEQNVLDPEFIERFNHIEVGQVFNSEEILDLRLALTRSGYFSTVESEVLREQATDNHVPVILKATASKPIKLRAGVGYGTDIGPRVALGAQYRRLNRKGHWINTNMSISEREPSLNAQYVIPIRDVRRDQFVFTASIRDKEYARKDGQSKQYEIGMSQNVRLKNWTRRIYFKTRYDNFYIGSDTGITTLVIPGITLNTLRADDTLYTRKGYSLTMDVHGSVGGNLSDETFVNARVSGAWVTAFGGRNRLILRGRTGVVEAEYFENLPPEERWFAGGDQSVRGYPYQDISPRDAEGQRTGGRYMYAITGEVDRLFYNDFGAAAFIDIGTSTNDLNTEPKKGSGIGLRWASPVGMVRVDLAWPINDPDKSKPRLHISIGTDL